MNYYLRKWRYGEPTDLRFTDKKKAINYWNGQYDDDGAFYEHLRDEENNILKLSLVEVLSLDLKPHGKVKIDDLYVS